MKQPSSSRPRLLFAVGLVTALGACANVDGARDDLARQAVCCRSIQELPAAGMTTPKDNRIEIDASAPVFDFPEGRSHFRVVKLDSAALVPGKKLWLRARTAASFKVFTGGGSWERYLHPAVTFLDDRNERLTTVVGDDPSVVAKEHCSQTILCGVVEIVTPIPAGARYAVIHSPAAMAGRTTIQILPGKTPSYLMPVAGAFLFTPGGDGIPRRVIAMTTGDIELEVI